MRAVCMRRETVPSEWLFWAKVVPNDETGCWEWAGDLTKKGYGDFSRRINGKRIRARAHRWSYQSTRGDIPDGLLVCHSCDNPRCVRPSHLFLGTNLDNMRDKCEKGRQVGAPRKDHCKHGHPMVDGNLYYEKGGKIRRCRLCSIARVVRRQRRHAAEKAA